MKKKVFRKDSFAAKFTAAALSVTLAFGMTPAMAFAQPAEAPADSALTALEAAELQDGTYTGTITTGLGMITSGTVAAEPYVVVNGSNAYLVFSSSNNRIYPEIAWAKSADLVDGQLPAGAQSFVGIPVLADGVDEYDMTSATTAKATLKGFTYVMPIDKAGLAAAINGGTYNTPNYLVRYMKGYSSSHDGDWYASSSDYTFAISGLTRASESVVLPQVPEHPADYVAPEDQVVEFETYVNNIGMMKIVSAAMVTNADGLFLRFALNGAGYKKMAWGIYEEVVAAGDGSADRGNGSWTNGYTNADGKIEFMLPMKDDVNSIPVVAISETHYNAFVAGTEALGQCMYPRMITLDMDTLTITADDYSAVQPLTVSVEGKAPAVTAVSLETVGGPASNAYVENATFTTDAQAAYLGTAEAAASATSGVVEAADGKLTIALTENNMGGGYAVKGGWDGKAAVAFKLADGTWVDTAVTVNKVAKTLAIEGEALPVQPVTATVSYTAQGYGAFMCAPVNNVTISSDLAESYGYTDGIDLAQSVSALDVLVAAHETVLGAEVFNKETAEAMLSVSASGWVSTIFGDDEASMGFLVNKGYPNDGTPSPYGGGYNGTMVNTTPVANGALVEFFLYQDSSWLDAYTYVDAPALVVAGEPFDVTVSGTFYMMGYMFADAAEMRAAAETFQGVSVALMDPATGAVTDLEVATDEDGKVSVTLPGVGDYYLVAYSAYDEDDPMTAALVMSPAKVTAKADKMAVSARVDKSTGGEYTMCKASDAFIQNTDNGMVLNIKLDTANYKGVFMGKVEDATLAATIMGTPTTDGFYEYQLPITEDMLGTTTDITILKKDGKTFYTNKSYSLVLNLGEATPQIGPSAKAQAIIDTINALPEASAISYDDAANLRSARSAYDALMSARKAEVSNYDKLVACEEAYNQLPVLWPALTGGYGWINGNDFAADPYFNVAYNDNITNLFVRIYVDARNFNRVLAMPASEVTADVTGGSLTAVADSDTGFYGFSAKEVQLGKVCHYTLAKIENGEVKATHEISFLLPSFRKAALEAGTYEMAAQSTVAALNNVPATLVSADGAMTATVTPSAAVAKIYLGTAEAAAAATEGIIEPAADGTLTFPVASIELPTAIAVFDGTAWTDEKIQIVADAETQAVITAIQSIYADGVDENGKALTRAAYWDIYPADKPAVEAAAAAYETLTDAQKAVVKQSNWSELAHAVAMFANAEDITAQIEALPTLTEVTTYEQAQAIMAAKKSYDEAGENIFTWYPEGSSGASIQENYIYKLMPADAKAKIADQAALAEAALKVVFTVTPSAGRILSDDTVTVDIAVKTVVPLGCVEFNLTNSDSAVLGLESIVAGAGLNTGDISSFQATLSTGKVSFFGNISSAANGIVIATATLKGLTDGSSDVALAGVVCGQAAETPDIEDAVVPAAQTIAVGYAGNFTVAAEPFTASGMKVVTFVGDVPEGMVPTMAGEKMLKKGDSFVALATPEQVASLKRIDLDLVKAEAEVVLGNGDASLNGVVNIVDAQIAYDISCGVYTDCTVLPMMGFFNAEVNGDNYVDAADALAIQNYVMRGTFA